MLALRLYFSLVACGRCSGPYVGNARIPHAARQASRQCRRIRDRCGAITAVLHHPV